MEETFSPSHDMAKDVGSGGKLLGEQVKGPNPDFLFLIRGTLKALLRI